MGIAAILGIALQFAPLIKGLIQGTENAVGPGDGAAKKELVVEALRPLFKRWQESGKLPADFNVELLGELVEAVFSAFKQSGEFREVKKDQVITPTDFKEGTAYPVRFNFSGPGTIQFKIEPEKS